MEPIMNTIVQPEKKPPDLTVAFEEASYLTKKIAEVSKAAGELTQGIAAVSNILEGYEKNSSAHAFLQALLNNDFDGIQTFGSILAHDAAVALHEDPPGSKPRLTIEGLIVPLDDPDLKARFTTYLDLAFVGARRLATKEEYLPGALDILAKIILFTKDPDQKDQMCEFLFTNIGRLPERLQLYFSSIANINLSDRSHIKKEVGERCEYLKRSTDIRREKRQFKRKLAT